MHLTERLTAGQDPYEVFRIFSSNLLTSAVIYPLSEILRLFQLQNSLLNSPIMHLPGILTDSQGPCQVFLIFLHLTNLHGGFVSTF